VSRRPTLAAAMAAWNPNAPQGSSFPNQRPANDPWLTAMVDEGIKFWAKRGVTVPADTAVDVADDLATGDNLVAGARALRDQNRIVLDGRNVGLELQRARSSRRSTADRRAALGRLGQIIYHELGHVGGIANHTETGLMSLEHGAEVPWEAKLLAHKLIPHSTRPAATPTQRRRFATDG
jgi:hypothetical protein